MRRVRCFFNSIKNLIRWFSIIWKDKDYDGFFMLFMLRFKINNMRKYHESRKGYYGWENEVKWMNIVVNLLDMVVYEKYWNNDWDYKKPSRNGMQYNWAYSLSIYRNGTITYADFWEHKTIQLIYKILAWKTERWWD